MTNCNQIKRLIDEAEQPELLPFEASHHLNGCAPCQQFAAERASLRALFNGIPRVNAPINFDAQLKARMTSAKARPAFVWLSPAAYMRFGAASAAILLAVFVAQYNGMLSLTGNEASTNEPKLTANQLVPTEKLPAPVPAPTPDSGIVKPGVPLAVVPPVVVGNTPRRGSHRGQPVAVRLAPETVASRVPGVLVRGSRGEVEVPMLPVSVGAQQQLINRSGRSRVQPIAISF